MKVMFVTSNDRCVEAFVIHGVSVSVVKGRIESNC